MFLLLKKYKEYDLSVDRDIHKVGQSQVAGPVSVKRRVSLTEKISRFIQL